MNGAAIAPPTMDTRDVCALAVWWDCLSWSVRQNFHPANKNPKLKTEVLLCLSPDRANFEIVIKQAQ